jgi:hypothetical protein
MSSTCFKHPSVHPQKDLAGCASAHPAIDQTAAYIDAKKKYHKTACTSLPEDENWDVRNMLKTLDLN